MVKIFYSSNGQVKVTIPKVIAEAMQLKHKQRVEFIFNGRNWELRKKAQITLFGIIAIIFLLSAGFYIYTMVSSIESQSYAQKAVALPRSLEQASLKQYVESCIGHSALEPVLELASLGGSINQTRAAYRLYNGNLYRYLCINIPGYKSCANTIILREEMEYELSQIITPLVKDCIDLDSFRDQGYEIDEGLFGLRVGISSREIVFSLKYPITLKKGETTISVFDYNTILPVPLGELYELANSIINSEISGGFDKDGWMFNSNASVMIDKHQPYPDIVYKLTKSLIINRNLTFKFALKLSDTVSQIGSYPPAEYAFGCCVSKDNTCFKNADYNKCHGLNLIYKDSKACQCPSPHPIIEPSPAAPQNCDSTYEFITKAYTGPSRKHGDSWCSYDSVLLTQTGKGGLAYVGSRHYKHSCINGKEIVEECRDYRDELCTENPQPDGSIRAVCRKNRWEDCYRCSTESCCTNTELRDCTWDPTLETDKKCFPVVPPGFRFWEGNGAEVCNVGTTYKVCDSLSCPSKWVDDTAVYCYAMGDCGNYRNIADKFTQAGFFNTDPFDRPSSFIFMEDNLNFNPREQLPPKQALQLGLDNTQQHPILGYYPQPASVVSILFSIGIRYLDYLGRINLLDFINPFKDPPEIKILDYSFCWNWQAPLGGSDCSKCSEDPFKPCSEYRCKSLGQLCHYEESFDGYGNCTAVNTNDNIPPKVSFDPAFLNNPYTSEEAKLVTPSATIKGVYITPRVKPYSPLKLSINTSEPARCSLNYLPAVEGVFFPAFWFGEPSFSTTHNISIRLPEGFKAPSKIYDTLNITSLAEISGIIFNLEYMYNYYMEAYQEKFAVIKAFTGVDVPSIIEPFKDMAIAMLQPFVNQFDTLKFLASALLDGIENSIFHLFVHCTDRAGNSNTDSFFIKLAINTTYVDNEPPVILGVAPDNTTPIKSSEKNVSLSLYINEPAECRYSLYDTAYENMPNSLVCPSSPYQVDPYNGGSYRCDTLLPFADNSTRYYFRCQDNPPQVEELGINIIKADNFSLASSRESRYLNLTSPNRLEASSIYLAISPSVYSNTQSMELDLYLDDYKVCRFSNETSRFDDMESSFGQCRVSDNLDIGLYTCNAVFGSSQNTTYNIACLSSAVRQRNTNTNSFVLNLTRASQLRNIIVSPEPGSLVSSADTELVVTLIKPISVYGVVCGYNSVQGQGYYPMQQYGDYIYKARLSSLTEGFHTCYINCIDNSGDEFTISTSFRVEITF